MQKALHIRTTVLPGGKVEIVDQDLPVGEDAERDGLTQPCAPQGAPTYCFAEPRVGHRMARRGDSLVR